MNCEVLDEARSVEVAIIISYPKREWDKFFFKNAHKISRTLPIFILKEQIFSLF